MDPSSLKTHLENLLQNNLKRVYSGEVGIGVCPTDKPETVLITLQLERGINFYEFIGEKNDLNIIPDMSNWGGSPQGHVSFFVTFPPLE